MIYLRYFKLPIVCKDDSSLVHHQAFNWDLITYKGYYCGNLLRGFLLSYEVRTLLELTAKAYPQNSCDILLSRQNKKKFNIFQHIYFYKALH